MMLEEVLRKYNLSSIEEGVLRLKEQRAQAIKDRNEIGYTADLLYQMLLLLRKRDKEIFGIWYDFEKLDAELFPKYREYRKKLSELDSKVRELYEDIIILTGEEHEEI